MTALHYFFGWYSGGVWSNLLASLVWAIPAFLWGRHHIRKIHRHLYEQDARNKLIHKHVKELHLTTNKSGENE